MKYNLYLYFFALLSSCGGSDISADREASDSQFSAFSDPVKYAEIANKAENGDKESIDFLVGYYSSSKYTDFRNLKYWTEKSYELSGSNRAYTNYILRLASHDYCDKAWAVLKDKFSIKDEFPFYRIGNGYESIKGSCSRKAD